MEIDYLYNKAKDNVYDYIDMLYIQAISKQDEIDKKLTTVLIEKFLKKRGYVLNNILGRAVMVKDFTCVYVDNDYVEVWHDIKNSKSVFVKTSILTGLPITLDYMERI